MKPKIISTADFNWQVFMNISLQSQEHFYGERTGIPGIAQGDVFGNRSLNTNINAFMEEQVRLDYQGNSLGMVLVENVAIGQIQLIPAPEIVNHRIEERNIDVYYSLDNFTYESLDIESWIFEKDGDGDVTITLDPPIVASSFKVHSRFDDRDESFEPVEKTSQFAGDLSQIIKLYQQSDEAKLEYDYDAGGNRIARRKIIGSLDEDTYEYYAGTNRLKRVTNYPGGESYADVYDPNGNLIQKGNQFTENADGSIVINEDNGDYWQYEYTIKNRLKAVYRNGIKLAEFTYDVDGNRIISDTIEEGRIEYVFNNAKQVLYEKDDTGSRSYIYAQSRQIARVAGLIGSDAEIVYYHHDNLGLTRMMTDNTGEVVWEQDY